MPNRLLAPGRSLLRLFIGAFLVRSASAAEKSQRSSQRPLFPTGFPPLGAPLSRPMDPVTHHRGRHHQDPTDAGPGLVGIQMLAVHHGRLAALGRVRHAAPTKASTGMVHNTKSEKQNPTARVMLHPMSHHPCCILSSSFLRIAHVASYVPSHPAWAVWVPQCLLLLWALADPRRPPGLEKGGASLGSECLEHVA